MSILFVLYTCSIVGVRQQSKNSLQTGKRHLLCFTLGPTEVDSSAQRGGIIALHYYQCLLVIVIVAVVL